MGYVLAWIHHKTDWDCVFSFPSHYVSISDMLISVDEKTMFKVHKLLLFVRLKLDDFHFAIDNDDI